ncbi:DUF3822 family protein [Aureibaculum marinum]|nr:DUF3822 family protein [Aureibaculum marinum]
MIQQKKNLITNSLDINNLEDSHLSIQFSLGGFSFCVLDKVNNNFVALSEFVFNEANNSPQRLIANISSIFSNEELLKRKYSSVSVTHINELFTLVPKTLFNEDRLQDYVSFNTKVFPQDYIVFDEIKNLDIISIFIPFVNINNFLIDQFHHFEYKHNSTVLIENLLSIYKYSLVPKVFAHIGHGHFELIVIANKKLQLYNTFKFSTKEDFIYYVLFTAEQLKLNPEKFEFVLLGSVEKNDALYSMAYKYIRNVSLLENRSKYSFDNVFTETDKRTYYSILNQY